MRNTTKKQGRQNFTRFLYRAVYTIVVWFAFQHITQAQIFENNADTFRFQETERSFLSFLLDDTYLVGGVIMSGIYYSNNYRNLTYKPGFMIGAEYFIPIQASILASTGFNINQRNFAYKAYTNTIRYQNLYLDIPLTVSYPLPISRKYDVRLLLGGYGSVRLHTRQKGQYPEGFHNDDNFIYSPNNFRRLDFGWLFGVSVEYSRYIARIRSFSGFIKLDPKDQGMLNCFNLELGYFLFRS